LDSVIVKQFYLKVAKNQLKIKDFLGREPDNKAFFDEITGQRVK
jgi:hypothetical protein